MTWVHVHTIDADGEHEGILESGGEIVWTLGILATEVEVDVLLVDGAKKGGWEDADEDDDQ